MKKKKAQKVELMAGDVIEHTTQDYGRGRVMEVKDGVATITFKKAGKKQFPVSSRYLVTVEPSEPPNEPSECDDDAIEHTPTQKAKS
ncbi:MAG: hypothetical protein GY847_31695 [Proteobacteria bacterium]|nr:hypothetical protein [Pseudomonadota bacterium]